MPEDPRQAAERYRLERDGLGAERGAPASTHSSDTGSSDATRGPSAADRAAFVETTLQQAIRRGDFDNLPGAGKPLEGLGETHDPDWWIRRKIASEQLTGLGPPALVLRVEHAEMSERLDALAREEDVREAVSDFNRRVIEARRQLLGGPPVVTPTRDVEEEILAWRQRRAARKADASPTGDGRPAASDHPRRRIGRLRRWWRRPPER